ncbi:MAG: hypothetical protein ACOCZM_00845, partial [Bacillota bacterium]
ILDFGSLTGIVEGNGFKANIDEGIEPGLAPFLYDNDANDGAIVEVGDNTFVLGTDYDSDDDEYDVNIGTKYPVELAENTINLYYGTNHADADANDDSVFDSRNVFGADSELGLNAFTITPEFAIEKERNQDDLAKYFTLNVDGDLGNISTEFNYKNIDDADADDDDDVTFNGVAPGFDSAQGFDFLASTTLADIVDVEGSYDSYEYGGDYDGESRLGITGEITEDNAPAVAGFDLWTDGEYATFTSVDDDSTLLTWNGTARRYLMDEKVEVKGELKYANIDDEYAAYDGDESATVDGEGELDQIYSAEYAEGMLTAGAEISILQEATNKTVFYADVEPETMNVMSWAVSPYAGIKSAMYSDDSDSELNLEAGVEAVKDINDYSTFTASYDWADKEYDKADSGVLNKWALAVDYDVSDDVTAEVKHEDIDFDADAADEAGYESQALWAGVSASF